VRVGLTALRRLSVVQVASPTLSEIRDEIGLTVGLAVWGAAGPTFVRFEETNDALIISGRPGSVMPVLSSSTGRVFGAYMPRSVTNPFIERELCGAPRPDGAPTIDAAKMSMPDIEALFAGVRRDKLAVIHGDLQAGLYGVSAPVFDHTGAVAGVITVTGSAGLIDTRLNGRVALTLAARARDVSRRMGWA